MQQNKRIFLVPGLLNSGGMYFAKGKLYEILEIWKNKISSKEKIEADFLVAHSLGCNWALENWSFYKNTKLILVNPLLPKRSFFRWFLKFINFHLNEKFPAEKEIVKGIKLKLSGLKECFKLLGEKIDDIIDLLPRENLIVISGKEDTFFCDEKFKKYIRSKNINLIELENVGHDWNEKIDQEIERIIQE